MDYHNHGVNFTPHTISTPVYYFDNFSGHCELRLTMEKLRGVLISGSLHPNLLGRFRQCEALSGRANYLFQTNLGLEPSWSEHCEGLFRAHLSHHDPRLLALRRIRLCTRHVYVAAIVFRNWSLRSVGLFRRKVTLSNCRRLDQCGSKTLSKDFAQADCWVNEFPSLYRHPSTHCSTLGTPKNLAILSSSLASNPNSFFSVQPTL